MKAQICSRKFFLLILVILMFFSGSYYYYYYYYKGETEFSKDWIPNSLKLQEITTQRTKPVNNMTYPAFRHPLAPPYPFPYRFLINQPDKCKNRKPFLVLMVIVKTHDFDSRHAIRETWGNESLYDVDVVRIFLLGQPLNFTDRIQQVLEEESAAFGDIIQQDFMDTYYNLTLKSLMGVEWVTKFCSSASYVMKLDNDMFLNVDFLVHQFLHPELPVRQNYYTGLTHINADPVRNPNSKYFLPKEVYPNNTFPPYCTGAGYILSGELIGKIYDVSQEIRVIPMEDVFIGMCLYELHVQPTIPPPGVFNSHRISYNLCKFKKVVTLHHYGSKELRTIWRDFWNRKSQQC